MRSNSRSERLADQLAGIIPETIHPDIPKRYEIIGDIAVISLPDHLYPYQREIAQSIIRIHPRVKTVIKKISPRRGSHRVAECEPIIGNTTRTVYRESGFCYHVDLAKTFFTTRLAGEHQRVSAMIQPDETILIPFAGVGPYVIPAAAKGARVIAIEINTEACRLLRKNTAHNRCASKVEIIRGDAEKVDSFLDCRVDRAIIPTPYGLDEAFWPISRKVHKRGCIHFYTFQNKKQAATLSKSFLSAGFETMRYRSCGNVAPSISRWVFDLTKIV